MIKYKIKRGFFPTGPHRSRVPGASTLEGNPDLGKCDTWSTDDAGANLQKAKVNVKASRWKRPG